MPLLEKIVISSFGSDAKMGYRYEYTSLESLVKGRLLNLAPMNRIKITYEDGSITRIEGIEGVKRFILALEAIMQKSELFSSIDTIKDACRKMGRNKMLRFERHLEDAL